MPEGNEQTDTVSREAHDRVKQENQALKSQVGEATDALLAYQRRDAARGALKGKVADPDTVADLLAPHLNDVAPDQVVETLGNEKFTRIIQTMAQPVPTGDEQPPSDDGVTPPASPAVEPPGGFGGPSPGSSNGALPPDSKQKVLVGSDEYKTAVANNDQKQIEQWLKDGVLESAPRPW